MKAQWAKTHNARRKQEYSEDPAYRNSVIDSKRAGYREHNAMTNAVSGLGNIGRESDFGTHREMDLGGAEFSGVCFTTKEMASLLGGYHIQVLYRMQRDGRFPKPEMPIVSKPSVLVYTLSQAQKLLAVMANHQTTKAYLQVDDLDTIRALKEAMT